MASEKNRKQDESSESGGEPIIAALLLEESSFPIDSFLKELKETQFGSREVTRIERTGRGVFTFQIGDEIFGLALMPVPYPASDIEGPIETTWMWPKKPPVETLKDHKAHLLITMMGGQRSAVRRRLLLTNVTAIAAKQKGVAAVYWGDAALVIFPSLFVDMAEAVESPKAPPLYLWVDLRAYKNDDGTTAMFTCGMELLGHMEFEIPSIDMKIGDLREWMLNIMYYVLENGPVLEDGQTLGMTADHKIRIKHAKSKFGHKGTVIRLVP